jgi:diguanylate cyclase (GGDEF)-like protein
VVTVMRMENVTGANRDEDLIAGSSRFWSLNSPPSRHLLELQLQRVIASADCVALLSVGIDRIDDINDVIGHGVGDQVLTHVTVLLVREAGDRGTTARTADNRYVIILPGADAAEAATRADAIINSLSNLIEIGKHQLRVSAKIGIAVAPDDACDAVSLLGNADAALHYAKTCDSGFQFFKMQFKHRALRRLTLEAELRQAIEQNELELHYQPMVCLRTGMISAAEALVRWRTTTGEYMLPDDFIPIAEESGLIVPLGEWVVDAACRHASESRFAAQSRSISVAVNMSPAQLRANPADMLRAALRRHSLPSGLLEIELTESAMIADVHRAIGSLLEIAELGVGLAIDDFGTGYSNLNQLGRLPVRKLKIARPLISGVAISSRDRLILRAVIAMAHAIGMKVVAEGVETAAQLSVLREECCDDVQGYLITKPLGAAMYTAWLQQWNDQEHPAELHCYSCADRRVAPL